MRYGYVICVFIWFDLRTKKEKDALKHPMIFCYDVFLFRFVQLNILSLFFWFFFICICCCDCFCIIFSFIVLFVCFFFFSRFNGAVRRSVFARSLVAFISLLWPLCTLWLLYMNLIIVPIVSILCALRYSRKQARARVCFCVCNVWSQMMIKWMTIKPTTIITCTVQINNDRISKVEKKGTERERDWENQLKRFDQHLGAKDKTLAKRPMQKIFMKCIKTNCNFSTNCCLEQSWAQHSCSNA